MRRLPVHFPISDPRILHRLAGNSACCVGENFPSSDDAYLEFSQGGELPMRTFTAILVLLLMSYPIYAREGREGTRMASASFAAASASTNTSDSGGDEANDQKTESDSESEGTETNGTDSDHETKTGAHSDNEADDTNGEMNSVKNATQASLKASAMKQSQSSLNKMAAALDAGLSPQQTIKALLEPAATPSMALSNVGSPTGLLDSPSAITGGFAMPASGSLVVATSSAMFSGQLTSSATPEPSAWILAALGLLAPLCKRRRKGR